MGDKKGRCDLLLCVFIHLLTDLLSLVAGVTRQTSLKKKIYSIDLTTFSATF